jgi:c-di-GMP-binding flagellar brake protein YcgR
MFWLEAASLINDWLKMAEEDLTQNLEQNTAEQPEAGVERRKSARRVLRTSAIVILSDSQTFEVRTVDVSTTGLAIVAPANPKVGVTFYIRFKVPTKANGAENFEAKVRVVHSIYAGTESGFKIGLSFIQLAPSFAAVIQKYLE